MIVLVGCTDPGHASQSGESSFGLGEETLGDTQPSFARMVAKDIHQVLPCLQAPVDDLAHGRIVSPASPSRASRSMESQSLRVILTAGPCSPSRSLDSSSCLARRFCASRIRTRRYSLAEAYPSSAIWASTNDFISSGREMFMVVIRRSSSSSSYHSWQFLPKQIC